SPRLSRPVTSLAKSSRRHRARCASWRSETARRDSFGSNGDIGRRRTRSAFPLGTDIGDGRCNVCFGQLLTHAPQQKRGPVGHTVGVKLWLLWVADRAGCWSRPTAKAEICQTLSTIPKFQGRHKTEYPRPSRRN